MQRSVRMMQSAQTVTQFLTLCLLSQLQPAAHFLHHQSELICCCLTVAAVLASSWPWLSASRPPWQLHKQFLFFQQEGCSSCRSSCLLSCLLSILIRQNCICLYVYARCRNHSNRIAPQPSMKQMICSKQATAQAGARMMRPASCHTLLA